MNKPTYEEIVIEIAGSHVDCWVEYFYTPADNGGREYPSSDEDYEIVSLELKTLERNKEGKLVGKWHGDIWKSLPEFLQRGITEQMIEQIKDNY